MDSKKLMISITIMSLVLVLAVGLLVHGQNASLKDLPSLEITQDSVFIGAWETKDHDGDESQDHVILSFNEDGTINGKFGKYDFSGSWKLTGDNVAMISNNKDKEVYQAVIRDDNIDLSAASSVTDSMTWTLFRR